ncbi:hypothetical protein BpHYR1_029795 [Brachionus plicatilis]|uniref:Uncharacterized protein n=1 Tax=Brachionus plicatilis TaxID=10195 RepID=A0A3M7T4K6_BRAPC|nr:hypothetical protein BpHYR1_029795 [Brachionus plicatilis]
MNKIFKLTKLPHISEKVEIHSDHKDDNVTFLEQVNFLIYLKSPWKLINNCPAETLNCLNRIINFSFKNTTSFDHLSEEKKSDLIEILIDYFKYIHESLHESFQKSFSKKSPKTIIFDGLTQNKIQILLKFSLIMWTWADKSTDFCIRMHETKFVRVLFKFLNDSILVESILSHLSSNDMYLNLALSYKSFLGLVHHLSKLEHLFPDQWKDTNCISCLLSLSHEFRNLKFLEIRMLVYFSLINLLDDQAELSEIRQVVEDVIFLVSKCSAKIVLEEAKLRRVYKIENEGFKEIAVVGSNEILWRLTELLNFLLKTVDLNEKLKYDIYEGMNGKVSLSRILYYGNTIEKEHALKLLWKLSMDEFVANMIRNDLSLYSYLLGLSKNQFNKNKTLLKYSNYILFLLGPNGSATKVVSINQQLNRNSSFSTQSGFNYSERFKSRLYVEEDISQSTA